MKWGCGGQNARGVGGGSCLDATGFIPLSYRDVKIKWGIIGMRSSNGKIYY